MSKLIDYDLYFIHIPKNGGSSFEKQFCIKHNGHKKITQIDKKYWNKTLAITRNPYIRLISCYNYFKLDNSYWHSSDGTKLPLHNLYNYCKSNTFENFIIDICINKKFKQEYHLFPQIHWLLTHRRPIIVTKLLKLENINEDLSKILNKTVNMIKINKSTDNHNLEDYYNTDLKKLVYNKYELDFQFLNYRF